MGELFSWAPFKFSETSYPLLGYLILGFFYPSHQAILVLKPIMRKNWGEDYTQEKKHWLIHQRQDLLRIMSTSGIAYSVLEKGAPGSLLGFLLIGAPRGT